MHKVIINNLEIPEKKKVVKDIYSASNAAEAARLAYSTEIDPTATPGIFNPVPGTTNRFLVTGEYMHLVVVAEFKND